VARFGKFLGRLLSDAGGYAIGTAASDAVRPLVQEEINAANALHPAVPLSPQVAAQAEIAGGFTAKEGLRDANYNGISADRYSAIRSFAGNAPGVGYLLQLRNRGTITDAEFATAAKQNLMRPEWIPELRSLRWQLPSAQDLAEMAVQGVITKAEATAAALLVGTDADTFDNYYRVSGDPIAPEQALTLLNRKQITADRAELALRQSRLKPEWVPDLLKLRFQLPPISDTIRFAVREVFNPPLRQSLDLDAEYPDALTPKAEALGLDQSDARDYWAAHWNLPSYTQATQMLFRGEITQAQFDNLLKALDFAPTWRGKLAAIAQAIPGVSDMIRFAVREVYDPASRARLQLDADYPQRFTEEAAKHGLSEEHAKDYWAAHWNLPSRLEGATMLHRGLISETEYAALLKALDFSPTWRDKLEAIARLVPGRIDLRRFYTAGIIDAAETKAGYVRLGYSEQDADRLTALAKTGSASKTKDLTAAQLAAEYLNLHIDRAAYLAALDKLGYSADEAEALATLADSKRVTRARDQFITRIHSQFVGHKIDAPAARAALTDARVTPAAIDLIMTEWEHEQAVNVRRLTQAQVLKAYKNGLVTQAVAHDTLTDQGLPTAEADLLLGLTTPPATTPPATTPPPPVA
jgi:hypothetical protein